MSAIGRAITSWYVVFFVMASLGVALGLVVFVFAFPGKPKIGVIHVPFTVIQEQSAYVIGEYLSYARQDDSIKAVVIKLTSPGGGAAASERLYSDTRSLRDEKPVVMAMDDLVASGGYMMAMGANHSYTTSSSIVGNVGVVSMVGPLIPPVPEESLVYSGPYKLSGLSRRDWIGMINQLKQAFAEMVVAERRGKLRISAEELAEARIYSGVDAVRLGLVDEIGATTDALEKAAELAGITNYTLVDVNVEVQRRFAQDLARILEPLTSEGDSTLSQILTAPRESRDFEDPLLQSYEGQTSNGVARLETLRELALSGILSVGQEDPLPQLPLEMNHPNFYYLYLGHAP